MLYRTFLHLPGVDQDFERHLWQVGCRTWWHLLEAQSLEDVSSRRLSFWRRRLEEQLLRRKDLAFFARLLPRREHWRLYKHFLEEAVFVDIETDGLNRYQNQVTVLGVLDRNGYRAYVAGKDLEEGVRRLKEARFWVTFGGSFFDWPFLKAHYPWLPKPLVHLDLCPLLKRLGLKGGLKKIERHLGLGRPEEVDGLDGKAAVRLWRRWRRQKDEKALATLIAYNREDVLNLSLLAELAYSGLTYLTLTGKRPALRVSSRNRGGQGFYGPGEPVQEMSYGKAP